MFILNNIYLWLLPKIYYCHDGLGEKHSQKDIVKMVGSKSTCPKWHFGQVGHGGKKTIWGFFFTIFPVKKTRISYNVNWWTLNFEEIGGNIAWLQACKKLIDEYEKT